jgi:hypothetical protein
MAQEDRKERLAQAYDHMLEGVRDWIQELEDATVPAIEKALDNAREKTMELNELTREEADKVGEYLRRDLLHLGEHLDEKKDDDLRSWFRMDLELIETKLADLFSSVADRTTVELERLREIASLSEFWSTGEITGPGILECTACGEQLHFSKTGHIPPCPKCHATSFKRLSDPS